MRVEMVLIISMSLTQLATARHTLKVVPLRVGLRPAAIIRVTKSRGNFETSGNRHLFFSFTAFVRSTDRRASGLDRAVHSNRIRRPLDSLAGWHVEFAHTLP